MNITASPLQPIKALVLDDLNQVNQLVTHWLTTDIPMIAEVGAHLIQSGGKRLRPLLVLLCARALNYEGRKHAVLAAVIEFIHTATLLHDDVVDDSKLRRGKYTANSVWGNQASVLVGDFLYSRSFQQMLTLETPAILELLANTTNTIAAGEVLQLLNCQEPNIDEERYLRTITAKTAILFSAATEGMGLLIDAPTEVVLALRQFGLELGLAFQLIDDLLDYTGDTATMGKQSGDDFVEGKPTLPLIYLLQRGTSEERAIAAAALTDPSRQQFDLLKRTIENSNAISYTYNLAQQKATAAKNHLSVLPANPYRDALVALCDFAVTRDH